MAAAATKDTKAPPPSAPKDTQRPPAPQYCFCCGNLDHTVKACKEQGDLKCDNHADTKSHKTWACNIWRKENRLVVHPWLLCNEATANQVGVDDESDTIFGSHPDDSLEVLSEADSSLTQPGPLGLHACHVTVTGSIFSDEEDEVSDQSDDDLNLAKVKRRFTKTPIQARLRQSKQGRIRAK